MQDNGFEPHDDKPDQGGKAGNIDYYKDNNGDIYFRGENGDHYEPIFDNVYNYRP